MTKPTVSAIALLPIRLFFGATFLYAGLDKLLDPSFFDPSAPGSLHAQLEAFARLSPLSGLIKVSLPLAEPIGLLIAIAEIGIGIGALTGIAFRVAAVGGALLSLLFFLTASWSTHPFYLGADLPYALGWITLAIAGHGDLLVAARIRDLFLHEAAPSPATLRAAGRRANRRARLGYGPPSGGRRSSMPMPSVRQPATGQADVVVSPQRRLLLQTGLLAGLAAIATSLAWPLRALGIFTEPPPPTPTPSSAPLAAQSSAPPAASPGASLGAAGSRPAPAAGRTVVATLADVQQGGGAAAFTVPLNAPAPLPRGDPAIVVQLSDGSFVAYDTVCTHAGCTVEWDAPDGVLLCPCHEAAFDPSHGAAVLQGPARRPLAAIPIVVDQAAGTITLGS
ncbi:MAG: Rieske 2Fe-2S domain-containing protein [Chloroflexi bacterium]|nr:Rieske 2Fe-2S domain-containing protein [Chloroflexota bacterium]